jgi:NAD(P)-dependent dehydrogenase (short-subunit alcohol dehydrogenase family)
MNLALKPSSQQIIVVTGASSGIGLVTARMAAKQGARVVVAARNAPALHRLVREIEEQGGQALAVPTDVTHDNDVHRLAEAAIRRFGGFDTWVNNAGISIYGRIEEVSLEDQRQLFETNFWGLVYGSKVAVEHLRRRGGALINVGSVLSDRAIPLQGMYSASKHAVKAFTDALRMELEHDGLPVSVTLVKPSAINTPYTTHARNYLPVEPQNPPPVYAPELVAHAILRAAQVPTRDIVIGGGGRAITMAGVYAPRLIDKVMEWTMFNLQKSKHATSKPHDALYQPGEDLHAEGDYPGYVRRTSTYLAASEHPIVTAAMAIGAGLMLAGWLRGSEEGD